VGVFVATEFTVKIGEIVGVTLAAVGLAVIALAGGRGQVNAAPDQVGVTHAGKTG